MGERKSQIGLLGSGLNCLKNALFEILSLFAQTEWMKTPILFIQNHFSGFDLTSVWVFPSKQTGINLGKILSSITEMSSLLKWQWPKLFILGMTWQIPLPSVFYQVLLFPVFKFPFIFSFLNLKTEGSNA